MRNIYFVLISLIFSVSITAQKASSTSEPVYVEFVGNSPTKLIVTSPATLQNKTRGFTKVNAQKVLIEGMVTDEDGIKQFLVNNFQVSVTDEGYFFQLINIKQGDNQLKFRLTDNSGKVFEDSYTIVGETSDPSLAIDELANKVGKYYALLIAVDDYQDDNVTDLDKPIKDATLLKDVLMANYTFDEENVKMLKNATRAEIIDELARIRGVVTEADNFLLFYAGHGFYDDKSEIGYWIPSDGMKSSTANWFRNSTLTDEIGAIKSKHTLLIADACFSGSIFKSRKFFTDASLAVNKLYELPSRKAMTSGTLTTVPDRSAFMTYLAKRLEGNSDKYLTSEQLFSSFKNAVINNSDVVPQYGTIQKSGDEGGDFIFIRRD